LKKASQFKIIGKSKARLDIPEKVNGSAIFGTDMFVEGMLCAAIARPPAYGAKIISYNRKAAEDVAGVRNVIVTDRGVAVCADTITQAWRGRSALDPKWGKGPHPGLNNQSLDQALLDHLHKTGAVARNDGNAQKAINEAAKKIKATYVLPYLAHATMEPMSCTAHVRRNRCDIWVPTQYQTNVFLAASKITGLKPDQIHIHTTYLGGGFGRRNESDVAEEAVYLSQKIGRPVKLIWTREEDMQNDFYRPGNCCIIEGGIDSKGRVSGWSHKVVVPSIYSRLYPDFIENGVDPCAVEGIVDMEYEIPNVHVEYLMIDTPVPVGFWRSVGYSHNVFTVECFVDELAHASDRDPLEFRLDLLKNHPRAARVLKVAAEKAGWGKPLLNAEGRGIAQGLPFGSNIAQVAEVSVNKKRGTIHVHRIVCAVDCGPVINPDIVIAQMESGIIFGLSAALKQKVKFSKGRVVTHNYDDYEILRLSETPEIEVHIVRSDGELGGIGEVGVPPVAPAVANSLFAATGARVRSLPLNQETVSSALKGV
jgi:isoquinoline 1-oxidoreductase beta subunit